MQNRHFLRYIWLVITSIFTYAIYGAILAAIFSIILTLIASLGSGPEFTLQNAIEIARGYLIFGALFGGLIGLVRGILTRSQT